MKSNKINISNLFYIFISSHLIIWTLVPTLTNHNLPQDTIEALAWGSNLDWGYNKHPPASAFFIEIFYQIFGSNDWAYYLLSQIFVIISFLFVWKLSEEFFKSKIYCLLSVLLLEGIHYYNFTTPEYNVYICELPFWALTVYFAWKGYNQNSIISWVLLGIFSAIGLLSHYLFIYLLSGIGIFFLYQIYKYKKFNFKYFISDIIFIIIILPHLFWLKENDFVTITYGMHRTGFDSSNYLNHFVQPLIFIAKQIGILIPVIIMCLFIFLKLKAKFNFKDKKLLFLICINIFPIFFIILTSAIMGVKIRTMWMTPFYLFIGIFIIYIFQTQINLKKLKVFVSVFLILFIFSPFAYAYISITKTNKRTDYPGKSESEKAQKYYINSGYEDPIAIVKGNEWIAGNLSYHLPSRPKWIYNSQGTYLCAQKKKCLKYK